MAAGAIILLLLAGVGVLEAANILILTPMPFYSHTFAFAEIFRELAVQGHNVTFLSPYPIKDPPPNWTHVKVEIARYDGQNIKEMMRGFFHYYLAQCDFCVTIMEEVFKDKVLMDFLENGTTKYDVMILESFFCQEPLVALSHKLNIPFITFLATSHTPWYSFLDGNEVSLHLRPQIRGPYTDRMTFFQRLHNFLLNLFELFIHYYHYIPAQQALMDKYMRYPGYEKRPPLLDMLRNSSLTLTDYHFSVGYPESLQPNSIPVGGLSAKIGATLPKELKTVMDDAKEGVIYLNFGSVLNYQRMPEEILMTALAAMRELNYTILFKWDYESLPYKPKNVVVRNWYPQPGILAHPNTRIFITHAGLHSIAETASAGVPVLCIPFFADQLYNSRFAEQAGFGATIPPKELTKESMVNGVLKVLNDPRYKENGVLRSKILHDRPFPTLENAIYWIEYVISHKGAGHLRPGRNDLSIYEILGIDIVLVILSFAATPFLIFALMKRKKVTKEKED